MAFLSFCVLIYKRYTEVPKRPLKIWLLDVSKQILSQLSTHAANVIFAMVLASNSLQAKSAALRLLQSAPAPAANPEGPDQCNYYLVTIVIDTSVGVIIACRLLVFVEKILQEKKLEHLKSGNYYKTTSVKKIEKLKVEDGKQIQVPIETEENIAINYQYWFMQVGIWLLVVLVAKTLVFTFQAFF